MTQKTCSQCSTVYDTENVNIPSPLPDGICFECGTELTQEQIEFLIPDFVKENREKGNII